MKIGRIWVSRKTKDEIYVGIDDVCAEKNPMRVEKIVFTSVPLYETDDKTAMCTISDDIAIKLMDDLWKIGIRPTNQIKGKQI